jgi:hypothetical protein
LKYNRKDKRESVGLIRIDREENQQKILKKIKNIIYKEETCPIINDIPIIPRLLYTDKEFFIPLKRGDKIYL